MQMLAVLLGDKVMLFDASSGIHMGGMARLGMRAQLSAERLAYLLCAVTPDEDSTIRR